MVILNHSLFFDLSDLYLHKKIERFIQRNELIGLEGLLW
jgi:hypothetical protein